MKGPWIPSAETLALIEKQGISMSLFRRGIPPFTLSVIYRQSSAAIESPGWYPETLIFEGTWERDEQGRITKWPRLAYQGEGWGDLAAFYGFTNPEAIKAFIAAKAEED